MSLREMHEQQKQSSPREQLQELTKQLYRSCKGDFVWVEKK